MAELKAQRVPTGYDGVDNESAPDYVSSSRAPVVRNMLTREGKLVMRGPVVRSGVITPAGSIPLGLQGVLSFGSAALLTYYSSSAGNYLRQFSDSGGGSLSTGSLAHPSFSISMRQARIGPYVYSPYGAGTAAGLLRWDGVPANTPVFLGAAVAPAANASDLTLHLERLFVVGGSGFNGAGGPNRIMWSIPGGPSGAAVATDWQDPITGLYNQLVVGSEDPDDLLIGCAHVGRDLLLFKQRSIYLLSGQTPATFAVRRIASDYTAVNVDTILEYEEGCYFLSDRGLIYTDGSSTVEVSQPVRAVLINAIATAKARTGLVIPRYRCAYIGGGCLMVTITVSADSGVLTTYFNYVYDVQRKTWAEITMNGTVPHAVVRLPALKRSYFVGDYWVADASQVVVPEVAATSAGFDVYHVSGGAVNSRSIPSEVHTRIQALSSPGNRAQLHRVLCDHAFRRTAAGTAGNAWEVSVLDGRGNTIVPATTLAAQVGSDDELSRLRYVIENYGEIEDAQVRHRWPDQGVTPPNIVKAEVYDTTLVFQPVFQRSNT